MADHGNPKPLAVAILLALVLTAWCLASNSVESGSTVGAAAAIATAEP